MIKLSRRLMVQSSLAALGGLPFSAEALATAKTNRHRITLVLPRADVGDALGFQAYLASINFPVEYQTRVVGSTPALISKVIEEIKETKPDLVFCVFTQISQALAGNAASGETPLGKIPLVFSSVTDPVAAGIVSKLQDHGRNVTGTRHIAPVATQLNVIRSYRPFDCLGVVYNGRETNMMATIAELRRYGAEQGFQLIERALPVEDDEPKTTALPDLVRDVAREGADFLYIGPDSLVASSNSAVVANAALQNRLPTFCATELPIKNANVLFGLVSRAYNVGGLAGYQAAQILLHGARPDTLPIEALQRFTLLLRMSVAKELGLYPPMKLLKMAEVNTDPL